MKVVGYTRRSRERDNGYGLRDQETKIRRWAEYRGGEVELVGIIADDDISGRSKPEDRPGLSGALAMLEGGEADALVFAKLDRLARSVMVWGRLAERSVERGWGFICLSPEFDTTTAAGRLVANIFTSIGQWELENTLERLQGGRREKAADGGYVGGHRFSDRYGYRLLKVAGKLEWVPVADEQEVIRLVRRLRKTEGLTLRQIADQLNEAGHPTKQPGGRWHANSVRRLLPRERF